MAVRLNQQAWRSIKAAYVRGSTARELAQQFGITVWTIHRRSSIERWRDEVSMSPTPIPVNDTHNGGAV